MSEEKTTWDGLKKDFVILVQALPGLGQAEKNIFVCRHKMAYWQGILDANLTYQPELERLQSRVDELEQLLNGK